ncbi:PREDICTED: uncharacterized protein LOC109154014 [Ipomoea nil]|uniref:uncharacterized protein LOC109154014 n=1 Tax=Ipomoea nil TaxID=35883 RepID=UPI0009014E8B|nr:PREDICTED: uncharacterized protein LOC109154014 [Ipomoea nil]
MNEPKALSSNNITVCSLYGLKQVPRAWFTRLHDFSISVGFRLPKTDVSLLIYSAKGTQVYLLVYVDDILIMRSVSTSVSALVDRLSSVFKVCDMGAPSFFLGIGTIYVPIGMLLFHRRYMSAILKL